jgi:hypothetical protein
MYKEILFVVSTLAVLREIVRGCGPLGFGCFASTVVVSNSILVRAEKGTG